MDFIVEQMWSIILLANHFPGQGGQQVYIVATDLNNIPPGSVILDPRTGN